MDSPPDPSLAAGKELALNWMYANGGTIIPASREKGHMIHVPFSLLPRPFPRRMYEQAVELAQPFNLLVDSIARDTEWLIQTLRHTATSDPFTGRLLDLLELVEHQEVAWPRQPCMLALHRSDYMVDQGPAGDREPSLKQIELNTISSSFGALSCTVSRLHSFLLPSLACDPLTRPLLASAGGPLAEGKGTVAKPQEGLDAAALAEGLSAGVAAYRQYRGLSAVSSRPLVLLFVVQPGERNVMDQRKLEIAFREQTGGQVPVRRVTLAELAERCSVVGWAGSTASSSGGPGEDTGVLLYEGQEEVALVYYRAAYTPEDHPTEVEWRARALAEVSIAIKCPSIGYHLAGTKKVQQALARPGQVERFVKEEGVAAKLRACFAGLWSLDPTESDPDTSSAIAHARSACEGYVMKPQREGGGNNMYGQDIARALAGPGSGGLKAEDLAGYILMERVWPVPAPAIFIRGTEHACAPALCELGIYGVFLGDGQQIKVNKAAGHLLRTKVANSDEGGVAAGFAVLDTPYLIG